jgi:hypothetical protein
MVCAIRDLYVLDRPLFLFRFASRVLKSLCVVSLLFYLLLSRGILVSYLDFNVIQALGRFDKLNLLGGVSQIRKQLPWILLALS